MHKIIALCVVTSLVVIGLYFAKKNELTLTIRLTEARYLASDYLNTKAAENLMLGSSSIARMAGKNYLSCGVWSNRGVGSSTIQDTTRYISLTKDNSNVKNIVLYLGENDLARTTDVALIARRYQALLEKLSVKFKNAHIHIIPVKPSPRREKKWDNFKQLNSKTRKLSETHPNLTFHEPEWMSVYLTGVDQDTTTWFLPDGVHLTEAGYLALTTPVNNSCK